MMRLSIAAQITVAAIHNTLYIPKRGFNTVYKNAAKLPEAASGVYSKLSHFMPSWSISIL
tara:strand:- start:1367 stop:1546 length:180 start_codon:yes stop_codon:yes gene_type:complete